MYLCPANIETVARLKKRFNVLVSQLFDWDTKGIGPIDDLIVNIGEVFDLANPVAAVFQVTVKYIEHDAAQGVSEMRIVIHRYPAHIHFYFVADRNELFFGARERVVKLDHMVGGIMRPGGCGARKVRCMRESG